MEQLEADFNCTPDSVHRARSMLQDLSSPMRGAEVEIVSLVLSEMVTNAIRHGCGDPDATIAVRLARTIDSIRIEVTQPRALFDIEEVRRRQPGKDRGWGILLIHRLCSSWGLSTNGVWAELAVGN